MEIAVSKSKKLEDELRHLQIKASLLLHQNRILTATRNASDAGDEFGPLTKQFKLLLPEYNKVSIIYKLFDIKYFFNFETTINENVKEQSLAFRDVAKDSNLNISDKQITEFTIPFTTAEGLVFLLRNHEQLEGKNIFTPQASALIQELINSTEPELAKLGNILLIKKNLRRTVSKCSQAQLDQANKLINFTCEHFLDSFASDDSLYCLRGITGVNKLIHQYVAKTSLDSADLASPNRVNLLRSINNITLSQDQELANFGTKSMPFVETYSKQYPQIAQEYEQIIKQLDCLIKKSRRTIELYAYKKLIDTNINLPERLDLDKELFQPELTDGNQSPSLNLASDFLPQKEPVKKIQKPKKKKKAKKVRDFAFSREEKEEQEDESELFEEQLEQSTTDYTPDHSIEENQYYYKFYDSQRKATFLVYKLNIKNEKSIGSLKFADRVKAWFDNPHKALEDQNYNSVHHKNFTPAHRQHDAIVRHSFPVEIDSYINQLGIISTDGNRVQICIPGEIRYEENGKQIRRAVVYTYAIDQNNICFHRCATVKPPTQILEEYIALGR